jgi:Holliday junction DNA helicase RuvA
MISSLSGEVLSIGKDHLVLGIMGIGFHVLIPASVRSHISIGDQVHLFTHLVVREDSLTLFGFDQDDVRDFFLELLGVNGVGPKIALAILSILSLDTIKLAVLQEQADVFARVPGVGRKTAQKILIQLQDKEKDLPSHGIVSPLMELDTQILSALTSLGYSVVESQSAIQSIPRDTEPTLDARLRAALGYFVHA